MTLDWDESDDSPIDSPASSGDTHMAEAAPEIHAMPPPSAPTPPIMTLAFITESPAQTSAYQPDNTHSMFPPTPAPTPPDMCSTPKPITGGVERITEISQDVNTLDAFRRSIIMDVKKELLKEMAGGGAMGLEDEKRRLAREREEIEKARKDLEVQREILRRYAEENDRAREDMKKEKVWVAEMMQKCQKILYEE